MLENYCETYSDSIAAFFVSESLGSGQIQDGSLYANVSLSGVRRGYFVANTPTILAGRYFSEKETDNEEMVAMISDKAVENLFGGSYSST